MSQLSITFLVTVIGSVHGFFEPDWNQIGSILCFAVYYGDISGIELKYVLQIIKAWLNILRKFSSFKINTYLENREMVFYLHITIIISTWPFGKSSSRKVAEWNRAIHHRQRLSLEVDHTLLQTCVFFQDVTKLRRDNIKAAIEQFNLHTCIKFVPRKNEKHYLQVTNKDGCSSYVGIQRYFSPAQPLNIAPGCRVSDTMHEMMHALGFEHEHQRYDRDNYVNVHLDVIPEEYHWIFKKMENDPEVAKLSYDYISLMHYTTTAFNNYTDKTTIEPLLKNAYPNLDERIGTESGFSTCDILKINTAYHCPGYEKMSTDVCQMGKVTRIPIKTCPADSQAFCKSLGGKRDDKCDQEPGKYLINCRKSCDNCEGTCYDSLDYDKNLVCVELATKMEQGIVKSCSATQKDWCPLTCGRC